MKKRICALHPFAAALLSLLQTTACSPAQENASTAQPEAQTAPAALPLRMSMLELMRASVEIPASSIWEVQYAEKLSNAQWLLLDQDAADLAASASLVAMPGTGKSDASWVAND